MTQFDHIIIIFDVPDGRLEAIALSLEAIASRLEAMCS